MAEVLRIENLWVEGALQGDVYTPIVRDVSVKVNQGEVVALIGKTGSGKSTIALAAMGYARPGCRISGGRVFLDGIDVLALDSGDRQRLRGMRVAYVAQSAAAAFNPALTIGAQVIEASTIHGLMSLSQANLRAIELYHQLGLPEPERVGRRYPHQVSGGQLQRLMVAMALMRGPDLLLLDEPTTALDVTTQIEVLAAIKEIIKQQHCAAIYVTHDLAVVVQIADQILVLLDGEVMERNTTDQIIHRPEHAYTKKLMDAVRPPPKANAHAGNGEDQQSDDADHVLVNVKNITAGYGRGRSLIVLRDVNLALCRGEVVGVIGESGCGKSTLARVMSGLLPQVSGEVLYNGKPLPRMAKQRQKKDLQSMQIVFQSPDVALNPHQRVRDILGRPLEFYLGMAAAEQRQRIAELLRMVDLSPEFESRYPAELSGGQKQRVNLARALAAEPEVILCDEVTSGLDTMVGAAILELLGKLQDKLGVAYVFISHDLSTVASFADQILVLYAGQVAEVGPTQRVLSPPYHPYTRLLLSSVPELRRGWLEDVLNTREAMSGIARAVEITDVGCPFYPRCPLAIDGVCNKESPPICEPAAGHKIACHREVEELAGDILEHG